MLVGKGGLVRVLVLQTRSKYLFCVCVVQQNTKARVEYEEQHEFTFANNPFAIVKTILLHPWISASKSKI